MTATFQSSTLATPQDIFLTRRHRRPSFQTALFQVEITDFDGDIQWLEVEANSISEAAEIAENIYCGDIMIMCINEQSI